VTADDSDVDSDLGEEMEDFGEGEMADAIRRAIAGIESDEELESETDAPVPKLAQKGVLKAPASAVKGEKSVKVNAESPAAQSKTPSTPHPVKGPKEVPQLNFESDDEEGEEESDEEEAVPAKKQPAAAAPAKKQTAAATPAKKQPVAAAPAVKKAESKKPAASLDAVFAEEELRRELRDKKSLFVKGFPKYSKDNELKRLHDDIVTVRHFANRAVAWLEFASEDKCDAAYAALQDQKIHGQPLAIDFCGRKSTKPTSRVERISQLSINPLALMVSHVPFDCADEQVKLVFPKSADITFRKKEGMSTKSALVRFTDEAECREAFDKGRQMTIGGQPVEVLYGRVQPEKPELNRAAPVKRAAPAETESSAETAKAPAAKKPKKTPGKQVPKKKKK